MNNKALTTCFIAAILSSSLFSQGVMAAGQSNRVSHIHVRAAKSAKPFAFDRMSVTAMPLLMSNKKPVANVGSQIHHPGAPGHEDGFSGTGVGNAQPLGSFTVVDAPQTNSPAFVSLEFGTASHPFNTHRVDTRSRENNVSRTRFYRAVGQLFVRINGQGVGTCSASLIKRGIIVTAAHCVVEFGLSTFFSGWQFVPALFANRAPFGVWNIQAAYVLTSFFDGTDACAVSGIVCANDIAILVASPQAGGYPGDSAGWLSYGWNGEGFTANNLALISQLGYPASHDRGKKMQQTNSQAFVDPNLSNNTVFGGRQTGGSSGGPLIVNLGNRAELSEGVRVGAEGGRNRVVGVASWAYSDQSIKQQGASPFTSENIVPLVDAACADFPAACRIPPTKKFF